jgi:hypothetical protein
MKCKGYFVVFVTFAKRVDKEAVAFKSRIFVSSVRLLCRSSLTSPSSHFLVLNVVMFYKRLPCAADE